MPLISFTTGASSSSEHGCPRSASSQPSSTALACAAVWSCAAPALVLLSGSGTRCCDSFLRSRSCRTSFETAPAGAALPRRLASGGGGAARPHSSQSSGRSVRAAVAARPAVPNCPSWRATRCFTASISGVYRGKSSPSRWQTVATAGQAADSGAVAACASTFARRRSQRHAIATAVERLSSSTVRRGSVQASAAVLPPPSPRAW
mmetsp:Transcript_60718/g.171114  ORF Transcript_60718/g.171114 Transcript_60718/m.171114 type:complete len:205 (-) Transcript_60718:12-626(-)